MERDLMRLFEDNQRLRDERNDLVDAVIEHAIITKANGQETETDSELWEAIGLHVFTDEEKYAEENAFFKEEKC